MVGYEDRTSSPVFGGARSAIRGNDKRHIEASVFDQDELVKPSLTDDTTPFVFGSRAEVRQVVAHVSISDAYKQPLEVAVNLFGLNGAILT